MTLLLFIWPPSGPVTPKTNSGWYLKVLKMICCSCYGACCCGSGGETVSYNFWLIFFPKNAPSYILFGATKNTQAKEKEHVFHKKNSHGYQYSMNIFFSSEWSLLFFSLYFYIVLLSSNVQLILVFVHQGSHLIHRPLRCLAVKTAEL